MCESWVFNRLLREERGCGSWALLWMWHTFAGEGCWRGMVQEQHEIRPVISDLSPRCSEVQALWKRGICQLMYLKLADIGFHAWVTVWNRHWFGRSVLLNNTLFLCFCFSISSSGSLYWVLNLCPPLGLWSEIFQYMWRLCSSCRWSLECSNSNFIKQFLHLNLLAHQTWDVCLLAGSCALQS